MGFQNWTDPGASFRKSQDWWKVFKEGIITVSFGKHWGVLQVYKSRCW